MPAAERTTAGQRRFVVGCLGSFLAVLAVALAFNVVVDPVALAGTGLVPTAVEPDRSIKLDLLQHLKRGPQILILGDSRGRQAQPSQLRRLTGHTAFKAAVTGGSAPDAYVFVRFAPIGTRTRGAGTSGSPTRASPAASSYHSRRRTSGRSTPGGTGATCRS